MEAQEVDTVLTVLNVGSLRLFGVALYLLVAGALL